MTTPARIAVALAVAGASLSLQGDSPDAPGCCAAALAAKCRGDVPCRACDSVKGRNCIACAYCNDGFGKRDCGTCWKAKQVAESTRTGEGCSGDLECPKCIPPRPNYRLTGQYECRGCAWCRDESHGCNHCSQEKQADWKRFVGPPRPPK